MKMIPYFWGVLQQKLLDRSSFNSSSFCCRLDFTNLVLETTNGAVTTDYLTVNGPTDVDPPAIAGTNTGYHSKLKYRSKMQKLMF